MPEKKYPVLPIIAAILKIIAVVLLIFVIILSITDFVQTVKSWGGAPAANPFSPPSPAVTKFGDKLMSLMRPLSYLFQNLILPFLAWLFADIALALRDIEFNTRLSTAEANAPVISPIAPKAKEEPGEKKAE